MKTTGLFFGKTATLQCDGNCNKAWGVNSRPRLVPEDNDDDFCYLSDNELGTAPKNPGTYEGGEAKPVIPMHNKWCWRECERSSINGTPDDFTCRVFNIRQA